MLTTSRLTSKLSGICTLQFLLMAFMLDFIIIFIDCRRCKIPLERLVIPIKNFVQAHLHNYKDFALFLDLS